MLASDILPPRTVSSRGMLAMLKRLETDSPNQYTFNLLPPSALKHSSLLREDSPSPSQGATVQVAPVRGGNAEGKGGPNTNPSSRRKPGSRGDGSGEEIITHHSNLAHPSSDNWSWLPKSARNSPTGLAFLYTKKPESQFVPRLAIAPPFPIQSETQTADRETLLQSIDPPLHVAIILIRYGYVAIAIAHDETLALTKTDTRWVPNQHRAGGQSANRFKRNREKWAREFFDKSARLAAERFAAYPHHVDHLIFGGDKHVINQFLQRANLPNNLSERILPRRLNPLRPNRNALKDAVRQTWSSTIYEMADVSSPLPSTSFPPP